jgi:hypothetical protein
MSKAASSRSSMPAPAGVEGDPQAPPTSPSLEEPESSHESEDRDEDMADDDGAGEQEEGGPAEQRDDEPWIPIVAPPSPTNRPVPAVVAPAPAVPTAAATVPTAQAAPAQPVRVQKGRRMRAVDFFPDNDEAASSTAARPASTTGQPGPAVVAPAPAAATAAAQAPTVLVASSQLVQALNRGRARREADAFPDDEQDSSTEAPPASTTGQPVPAPAVQAPTVLVAPLQVVQALERGRARRQADAFLDELSRELFRDGL